MRQRRRAFAALLTAALLLIAACNAFQVSIQSARITRTTLWGKVKRGKLAKNVSPGGASSSKKPKKNKSPPRRKSAQVGVSTSLAEWASSQETQESIIDSGTSTESESTAEAFVPFERTTTTSTKKSKNARRSKQSARKAQEEEREEMVVQTVTKLEEMLEEKSGATLDDIIATVRELVSFQSGNLRTLTKGAKTYDYRLAWVGSDDAICHIGTGLHKVPLARLKEIFMTLKGKNRIELLEVIRVLGPFPSVRNTLQGETKVELSDPATSWRITMDSMVDGTGKEILAGKEDNVRNVDLQVYFADPNAIVAVVPPEKDSGSLRKDPFEDNGAHVLVFVREDELDAQLEALRA